MNEVARNTEFISMLTDIRAGSLCHELDEKLKPLVKAVLMTGKKGVLEIKISLKPDGIGRVCVSDVANVKMPSADMGNTRLFATEQGQLLADDPRQMHLPLSHVLSFASAMPVAEVIRETMPVAVAQ